MWHAVQLSVCGFDSHQVAILGKFFAHICLSHQAVLFGTSEEIRKEWQVVEVMWSLVYNAGHKRVSDSRPELGLTKR